MQLTDVRAHLKCYTNEASRMWVTFRNFNEPLCLLYCDIAGTNKCMLIYKNVNNYSVCIYIMTH